ncbi:hypothetical protein ACHAWF_008045 [Thalassiosira exigua]
MAKHLRKRKRSQLQAAGLPPEKATSDDERSSHYLGNDGSGVALSSNLTTKEGFETFRSNLLARVPKSVKDRFREGGFCKWGRDWLPVLELGPFDVEPGRVRDLWLKLFEEAQKNGREMNRLILWYGVQFEDRGRAYSFVKGAQLVAYEEGTRRGYCNVPCKVQAKIGNKRKLNKTEELHMRGLVEIEADMQRDKSNRAQWMMQFKEVHESSEEDVQPNRVVQKRKSKKECSALSPLPESVGSSNTGSGMKSETFLAPELCPSAIASSHIEKMTKVKVEPVSSTLKVEAVASSLMNIDHMSKVKVKPVTSSQEIDEQDKSRRKPTPEECHAVVLELGRLHPDVIELNDQRRNLFALRRKQSTIAADEKNTPITDAIISTLLSQNTTAANQDRAFASLKRTYPGGWDQVANETDLSRIEGAIRVAGLAQIRAERMQSMLKTAQLERGRANFEYLQHLPFNDDIQRELSRFKGMGPKTISCVLLFALGKPDFPVDTHVLRISKQMGWVPQSFSREAAYEYLNGRVPNECKLDLHCLLVTHGKQCHKCAARGKAQFPPKIQWVCPMAGIRNGTLLGSSSKVAVKQDEVDKQEAAVKQEVDLNRLFRC